MMTTNLDLQGDLSVDQAALLELAGELDRFSRRFERFCTVQLEQLQAAARRLADEQEQWERRRAREMRQIEENRRALQEAWAGIQDGSDTVEMPVFVPAAPVEARTAGPCAGDPLRVLLAPGDNGEMLIGQTLLALSRMNRAHGGAGCRFELSTCYRRPSGGAILDLHVFPAVPLVALHEGEITDEVHCWQRYKSAVALLPLGRGLDRLIRDATEESREHPVVQTFISAARRAQDGDARTAEAAVRGQAAAQELSERLVEQFESHRESGLAMQAVALS